MKAWFCFGCGHLCSNQPHHTAKFDPSKYLRMLPYVHNLFAMNNSGSQIHKLMLRFVLSLLRTAVYVGWQTYKTRREKAKKGVGCLSISVIIFTLKAFNCTILYMNVEKKHYLNFTVPSRGIHLAEGIKNTTDSMLYINTQRCSIYRPTQPPKTTHLTQGTRHFKLWT